MDPASARLWGLTRLAVVLADSGPGQARDEDDIDEAEIMQKAQKKSFLHRKFKILFKKRIFPLQLAKSGGASY